MGISDVRRTREGETSGGSPSARSVAIDLASFHQLHVFPVNPDKTPATAHGFKDASNDPLIVASLFARAGERVGLWPGPSGLVVVDIDVKDGGAGEVEWADLGGQGIRSGPEVVTPSGGRHIYFRKPEGLEFDNTKLSGSIDIRADGGYVLVPSAETGYEWDLGWAERWCDECDLTHPLLDNIPPFPEQLIRYLREQKVAAKEAVAADEPIPAGARYDTLFRLGRSMRYKGVPERAILAALLETNRERCQPPHPDSYIKGHVMKMVMNPNDPPINPAGEQWEAIRIRHNEGGPLNWPEVFQTKYPPVDWVPEMEGLAISGRATNLYGPAGTGKSELVLHRAAMAAKAGQRVLWLDREMTEADVRDRLVEMGFTPAELASLIYVMYPDLPLLDTEEGGSALVAMANMHDADVTIIDSLSKFVRDEEGETHTSFYLHTMLPMRLVGRSFLMIDHTGKDLTRKARGASQKVDNVDLYMEITRRFGIGSVLTTKKQRHSWVMPEYTYRRFLDPLDYRLSSPPCAWCGKPATGRSGPKRQWKCDSCNPSGPSGIVTP